MLLGFLLVLLVLICIALTTVILLQRSEGGALGMGGGPSGFMSARGAGDLLTRTTGILAAAFFVLCLLLTILTGHIHSGASVVDRLKVEGLSPDALNHAIRPAPAPGAAAPPPASQFDAPRPEVHTAPATAGAAVSPPPTSTSGAGTRGDAASQLGYQPAPQTTPTTAPNAAAPKPAQTPSSNGQSAPK